MKLKKLVCYYQMGKGYPQHLEDIKFLLNALSKFNEKDDAIIVLPDHIKLEYLDAFSLKKFVKTIAMRLKLRLGK